MTRVALCIVILAATFVGQQQASPNLGGGSETQPSTVITVDPLQVRPISPAGFKSDTDVLLSSRKGTVQQPRSEAPATLDMRPTALCARDMNDALNTDKNYIDLMGQPELEGLYKHALDCLLLQQNVRALRRTTLVLEETRYRLGFFSGFKSGTSRAAELEQAAIDNMKNANGAGKESLFHDYDALVDRYNSLASDYKNHDAVLVNRYNSLVNDYNRLLGLAQQLVDLPPARSSLALMPPAPPQPREVYLSCTASPLPGNMTAVSCW